MADADADADADAEVARASAMDDEATASSSARLPLVARPATALEERVDRDPRLCRVNAVYSECFKRA